MNNKSFLLTLGYGRTGSTIIGHILNNHPNCLVSNESRFLQNLLQGYNIKFLINQLINNASKDYNDGLNFIHQKDSKNIKFKKMPKKNILILGDKKSGGNTTISLSNPIFFNNFIKNNTKIIINLRNPLDVLVSCKKNKIFNRYSFYIECNENSKDEDIFRDIIYYFNHCINIYKNNLEKCIIVYYEDLLNDKKNILQKICNHLDIFYYKELLGLINSEKIINNIKIKGTYLNILKTMVDKDNIDFLKRYINDNN